MDSWFFPLKRVAQRHLNGCGVACVATVCGLKYKQAIREFFPRRVIKDDRRLCVNQDQMARVIRRQGFSVRFASATFKLESLKHPAIIMFDWEYAGEGTHTVVWDPFEKRFIDPGSEWGYSQFYYLRRWRSSNLMSLIITGRRREAAAMSYRRAA